MAGLEWLGWTLTGLAFVVLLADGLFHLFGSTLAPKLFQQMMDMSAIRHSLAPPIGVAVTISSLLYIFPQTCVLGAILLTGFLGGAIAVDARVGPTPGTVVSILLGLAVWGGLFFLNADVRALLPLVASAG